LRDNYGHELNVEKMVHEPVPGNAIHVTLDIQLQQKAESLLAGEQGSIVVLNADTGEVYALASRPGYDPSVFVNRNTSEERAAILTGKPNRMMNRGYQQIYAPGSTFKIMLAAAALEEGVIDENTTHYCSGQFRLSPNGRPWHCWWRRGHGKVNVVEAIATSCDVFFYQVGLALGVDKINEWCDKFAFGGVTGLDLPGEVPGLVPGPEWKKAVERRRIPDRPWDWQWFDGDTVNLSIGQGSMAATPLQIAVLMSAVVNGGRRVRPYLVQDTGAHLSEPLLSEKTIRIVQKGMQRCVEKTHPIPTGTGKLAHIDGMTILGKTGSAQMVSLEAHAEYKTDEEIPKELRDHAWFMAGVMDRSPRIAICVMVEHGHHGSSAAAPLAKEVIEFFYEHCVPGQQPPERLAQAGSE
jgi:penicillin-binding protein 2